MCLKLVDGYGLEAGRRSDTLHIHDGKYKSLRSVEGVFEGGNAWMVR
jgi:hypothetical protein